MTYIRSMLEEKGLDLSSGHLHVYKPAMAHTEVRPRRLSYAGFVKPPQQKSRRVSDGGQLGLNTLAGCGAVPYTWSSADADSNASSMLHSVDAMNSNTGSRYDVNKNRPPARRISRPSDDSFRCSQQSVLSAMDRFVRAVDNMDSTVLVPSRLQDIDVDNENSQFTRCLPPGLDTVDVYGFYNMLKEVKTELLWGPSLTTGHVPSIPCSGRNSPVNGHLVKHVRQSSDDSMGSTGFPSDQDTDSDIESVVTDRDSVEDQTSSPAPHLANAFRHHLLGLHTILHELADSADYLSSRYQEEVDASSL